MSAKTQVFVTGATGYIGGSVLDRLLRHPTFVTSEITVLVRRADKIPAFESLGFRTVLGSYDDHELLEKQASLSDVVFAFADADNAEAAVAILSGLKTRHAATGQVPILIHTSGTGALIDNTGGNPPIVEPWDDEDIARLDTIAGTQIHRNVDTLLLAADKEGYVKTYIVLPSTIYGIASGRLADLGIQNVHSIQIPLAVSASISKKRAGYVGPGLNIWPNVHIDDITDLYIVLYDAVLEGKAGHGREGLYFGENGHHSLRDVAAKIGEALHDLGVSETPEPCAFAKGDYPEQSFTYLALLLGSNCRCKANRARALGWQPKYSTDDLLKSLRGEVERRLKRASRA